MKGRQFKTRVGKGQSVQLADCPSFPNCRRNSHHCINYKDHCPAVPKDLPSIKGCVEEINLAGQVKYLELHKGVVGNVCNQTRIHTSYILGMGSNSTMKGTARLQVIPRDPPPHKYDPGDPQNSTMAHFHSSQARLTIFDNFGGGLQKQGLMGAHLVEHHFLDGRFATARHPHQQDARFIFQRKTSCRCRG